MLYSNYDDLKKTIIYTTSMSRASPTTISYPDANIKPAAWFFSHLIPRIDHIDIRWSDYINDDTPNVISSFFKNVHEHLHAVKNLINDSHPLMKAPDA